MTKFFISICLILISATAIAADTSTETDTSPDSESLVLEGESPGDELLLSEEESEICAVDVVGGMIEDKAVEEITTLAIPIATALKDQCQCDAVAVRTMTEFGIPFDVSFNTLAEVCELDGTELGELSRALEPFLGNALGGPGGEVSP